MIDFLLNYFPVLIPIIILLIKSGLKHSIGKHVDEISYVDFLLDLPIDLLFVSIALNVSYIFKAGADLKVGFGMILFQFLVSIIVILVWRYASIAFKEQENITKTLGLGLTNFILTIPFFVQLTQLIVK
ncbi:MAG: hypothetical protein HZB59_00750 [Ignavibacteriales bacterium]|nr:hypothetical protein [Ignavibacteriales bacterium]